MKQFKLLFLLQMMAIIFIPYNDLQASAEQSAQQSAEQKGLAIAQQIETANKGFKGETSEMEMILINAYKEKIHRKLQGMVMEVDGEGDKSLITFLHPADVKGTKMLTWAHQNKDDEQWLYLPAMRRVKRISSNSKSSSFMGSEFSYEDLGSQAVEKYNFKLISEDENSWVLERYPKSGKQSGYSKQILWAVKKYHGSSKIEYYDRKNELLKTATFHNYTSYKVGDKTLWRPASIHMINAQTKKESIFSWDNRKLGVELKARDFDSSNLR